MMIASFIARALSSPVAGLSARRGTRIEWLTQIATTGQLWLAEANTTSSCLAGKVGYDRRPNTPLLLFEGSVHLSRRLCHGNSIEAGLVLAEKFGVLDLGTAGLEIHGDLA
jgi:hypothetical protein